MEATQSHSLVKTGLAIPFALVVWALVYVAAHAALFLLDSTRGLADDWLQIIFREWFTAGLGGYAAIIAVDRLLPTASLKWTAIIFCTPLVLFYVVVSMYIIVFHSDKFDYSLRDQMVQWGMAIATCVGAYIGCVQRG